MFSDVWAPTDPEMHASVASRLGPELLSPSAPIFSDEELKQLVDPEDEEEESRLREIIPRFNPSCPCNAFIFFR